MCIHSPQSPIRSRGGLSDFWNTTPSLPLCGPFKLIVATGALRCSKSISSQGFDPFARTILVHPETAAAVERVDFNRLGHPLNDGLEESDFYFLRQESLRDGLIVTNALPSALAVGDSLASTRTSAS